MMTTLMALLSTGAMAPEALMRDVLVCLHLLAMAVGLGSVMVAEVRLLLAAGRPLCGARIAALWGTHRLVLGALAVLWLTGAGLAALAIASDPSGVSPKLFAKIATVGGLSLTGVLMGLVGLPLLAGHAGARPLDLGLGTKLLLCLIAGLSTGGWLSALMLGAAAGLREATGPTLALLAGGVHLAAVAAALCAAVVAHLLSAGPLRPAVAVRLS